jgi:hypothetical protein
VREADLQADIRYLATVWAAIQKRNAEKSAPAILYSEHDLPLRIVRDLAGPDTKRIVTDDRSVHEHIQQFVDRFVADPKPQIELYEDPMPIFDRFGLEHQIHANLERKVWLKSGGSLVIDKSEALTSIDVNTGRFVGKRDLEETVFKTNLEAVQEVVRQLRFRNLGGLIIIDLIDMESASNRDKVYRALQEALRADKARTNILKISELGLVEMTRKRTRENLVQTLCEPCSHCEGRSYVLSRESVAFRVLREIRKHLPRLQGRSIAIAVNPHVAEELLIRSKQSLADLSQAIGKEIEIRARPGMHQEQFELLFLEPGPPAALEISWLRDRHPDAAGERPERSRRGRRRRGGRGRHGAEESTTEGGDETEAGADEAELLTDELESELETDADALEALDEELGCDEAGDPKDAFADDPADARVDERAEPFDGARLDRGTEPDRRRGADSAPERAAAQAVDGPGEVPAAGPLGGARTDAEAATDGVERAAEEPVQAVDGEVESRIIPRSE